MMTLDQVREALRDRNLAEVSRVTHIPYYQLQRLRTTAERPTYELVAKVVEYLESGIQSKD